MKQNERLVGTTTDTIMAENKTFSSSLNEYTKPLELYRVLHIADVVRAN